MKKTQNILAENWETIDDSMVRTQKKLTLHHKFSYFDLLSVDIVNTNQMFDVLTGYSKTHISGVDDSSKQMIVLLENDSILSEEDMDEFAKLMLAHYHIPSKKWNKSLISDWVKNYEEENTAIAYSLQNGEFMLVCLIPLSTVIFCQEGSIA